MPVEFSIDGNSLPLTEGLPENYQKQYVLRGTDALQHTSDELSIAIQKVETSLSLLSLTYIEFKKAVSIKCKFDYGERLLLTRTAIDHPAKELIKAAGTQHFHKNQFTSLFGQSWQSLLTVKNPCIYIFLDIAWKEELLAYRLKKNMLQELGYVCPHVPNRLQAGRLTTSVHMDKMLHIFRNYNYHIDPLNFLDINMDRYLTLMLSRINNINHIALNIKEEHWMAVRRAVDHIYDNLYAEFTIPQLSQIALTNQTNLKHYFQSITGFTIDDFKTYMRLKPALLELAHTDKAVKEIYWVARYSGLSPFCAGFRKVFLCTPTEVRSEGWDISHLLQ